MSSEPKRVALISLSAGDGSTTASSAAASASLPTKNKDKKSNSAESVKTQRFSLTLPDSTEKSCPEFNFADLLASITKKKEGHGVNGSTPSAAASAAAGPLDPYAEDDEDQLRSIAKKFEEKYGLPVAKKKKSRKYDDYVDLGAGYDETDPFIDNTDAYDEIVPAEVTTVHGGFYINSGALEFKPVEKTGSDDAESESESDSSSSADGSDDSAMSEASTTPVATAIKKRRVIESDDDDSNPMINGSSETDESKKKKARMEEQPIKLKKKVPSPVPEMITPPIAPPSSTPTAAAVAAAPVTTNKKPRPSVKDLLLQKREKSAVITEPTPPPVKRTSFTPPPPPIVQKRPIDKDVVDLSMGKATPPVATTTTTTDSGESDSSGSSSDSSDSESGGEEEEESKEESGVEARLPSNLTAATLAAIEDIRKAAATSEQQGKCRFFSSEINKLLLSIELQTRQYSCSKRQAIFTYLASFLPCTKHTLLKRAKNLVIEDVDSKLKPAIRKLQLAVEKVIGEQIERHATLCQQLAEANPEKYFEYYRYVWDPDLEPAGGTDEEEKKPKQSQPRRRFQWSKDIRSVLHQVVYLKSECFNWSKLRKESASEYIMRFLDSEIRALWPKGWMTAKILFKESHDAHSFITSATKGIQQPIPGAKKSSITPRAALVDTLAPTASITATVSVTPVPSALLGLGLPAATTLTPTVPKDVKKSVLKDRMGPSPLAAAVVPPPQKHEKIRTSTHDNGVTAKSNDGSGKHRTKQQTDPTCSAARTEIHHHHISSSSKLAASTADSGMTKVTYNKVDSIQPFLPSSKSHARENLRTEPIINPMSIYNSLIEQGMKRANTKTVDSLRDVAKLPLSLPADLTKSVDRQPMLPRLDSIQAKLAEAAAAAASVAQSVETKSSSKNISSSKPPMASFVDSGMRWKETQKDQDDDITVLDLTDDAPSKPPAKASSSQPAAEQAVRPSSRKTPEETEDQELLLQRDLAMVLEEISQINHLVDTSPVKSEPARTNSVIKSTNSLPSLTPPVKPTVSSGGSAVPPKLLAHGSGSTRTPPPTSRSSPTSASLPRTASPLFADSLKQSSSSSSLKMMANDFIGNPPSAHSSNRHLPPSYFSVEHGNTSIISPEKTRKSEQPPPPLPAHQQLPARSSPSTVFRNYPTASSLPNSNRSASSHSIESLMQMKRSPTEPSPAHRSLSMTVNQPQAAHSQQQQQQLPKTPVDPLLLPFMKNTQTNPHADYNNYYSHPGTGHH